MVNHYLIEWKRYLLNAYPGFVTKASPGELKGKIPIFISHRTSPITFEEKLIFIKENNYNTITLDKLYTFLTGNSPITQKSILLTFDDGDNSIYHVAYPLLKKYGLFATVFICPAYIKEEPLPYNPGIKAWLSWREIEEMHKSGLVDFQSHTLNHERIFTHPHIKGFYKKEMFKDQLGLDIPTMDLQPGSPIYTIHSRMERYPRYFDSPSVSKKCIENRDKPFLRFRAIKWLYEYKKETRYETLVEQRQNIFSNLLESKRLIEERLNKEVLHLAYPYGVGSHLAVECSKEAGFKTNLWGPICGNPITGQNTTPYKIPRIKDDFILRLPGENRQALTSILLYKWKRRQKSRDIY